MIKYKSGPRGFLRKHREGGKRTASHGLGAHGQNEREPVEPLTAGNADCDYNAGANRCEGKVSHRNKRMDEK